VGTSKRSKLTAKVALATANFEQAGVADCIMLHHGVAIDVLRGLSGAYDLIFLDADRASYMTYVEHLVRLLSPGALLVTDNVMSHAQEVSEFLVVLRADTRLTRSPCRSAMAKN
jgi:predicted O-methyltransferase YrrM